MNKWQVVFIDAGSCEILEPIEVECYRITNATKLAAKLLNEEQEKAVVEECTEIRVTKAP